MAPVLVALVLLAGCGGPKIPPLGQVSGTVTMKGKPLMGIDVVFSPDPSSGEAGRSSRGRTDAEGKYTLTYRTVDGNGRSEGAAIGQHIVTMSDALCINSRDKPIPYRIGLGLAKASKSPFTETVIEGEQTIDFDLTKYRK